MNRLVAAPVVSMLALVSFAGLARGQFMAPNPAPTQPAPAKAPQAVEGGNIKFEVTDHDFGAIFDNEKQTTKFSFTNPGPGKLVIKMVKPTCGCTSPKLAKTEYEVGESGTIEVTFDPHNRNGTQAQSVAVETNHPTNPTTQLNIRAMVRPVVVVEPAIVQLGEVNRGETRSATFNVLGRTPDFKVQLVTFSNPDLFDVSIGDVKEVEHGGEKLRGSEVTVTLKGNARIGAVAQTATIRTNDPRAAIRSTQIMGSVVGDISADPKWLSLGQVESGKEFVKEFKVASRSGKPFKIEGAETRWSGAAAREPKFEFTPLDPKNPVAYTVRMVGVAPNGNVNVRGDIMLKTNVAGEELVRLPFNGVARMPQPVKN
ncbi:MAG: DUF1573 domain-containing protein [Planctomycetota bacterium]|nr:DUF1573 domain-containing protein [Planctomycetota bacterium]